LEHQLVRLLLTGCTVLRMQEEEWGAAPDERYA
jgi:hypothetical protein